MVFDKNNHYQETAAQLRQKIKQFKKRPAYMVPFLKSRGGLPAAAKGAKKAKEVPVTKDETTN